MQLTEAFQRDMDKLNRDLARIMEAEKLAAAFSAGGVATTACYSFPHGLSLKATMPIEVIGDSINTLHKLAAEYGRTLVNERNARYVLVAADHREINTSSIELYVEEI
ncbi:hypothetical protein [Paludibacterium denitrificans]|uniref:Uncharacterized protein n=1 Tax=Paludibacterium denitrificans TaxID=2675226 RepID=A0A844GCW3_9NEIS|nr:hypothetical protein [Paludibacterium denitrificans]MTD32604.1 hypothetical protein [Paludibacterium denitrificans]